MEEVLEDVYRIEMPRPEQPAYLAASPDEPIACHVIDGEQTVLFGTGYGFSTRELLDHLDELGGIDVVVAEHFDTDHYGAVPGIFDHYDDVTFAMPGDDAFKLKRVYESVYPDVQLRHDDVYWGVRAVAVPGHTYGNMAFLDESRELLIAGDTVVASDSDIAGEGRWSGAFAPPGPRFNENDEKARANLVTLADYAFDDILLTHGEDVLGGAAREFERLLGDLDLHWELSPGRGER